jgi:uncharacterized repeat protein (TIGR02543 family)
MDWDIDADEDWLSFSPTSGSSDGDEEEVEVSVDPDGLDADEYEATITISSPDADNSPRHINVTLEVLEEEDDTYIAVYPDEFEFTAEEGGSDPDDQVLEIWNGGPGSMDWEVESDEDWLDVSPDDGSSDGDHSAVTLSVDIDGLDADDYSATITITSGDADNSPVEIDVTLEVEGSSSSEDEPEIGFDPDELEFEAEEDGDNPREQTLRVWNDGDGDLDWSVSANADWLLLDPEDGTSTGEQDRIDVSVDIDDLDAGEYTARITIRGDGVGSERVDVTLVVEEAEDAGGGGDESGDGLLVLHTNVFPAGAGTITRSVASGPQGYDEGAMVDLTAVPSPGYAFTGWSGDAAGTENPVSVTMSSDRSVSAYFVRFDAAGLPGISLTYASPEMAVVSIIPYPVQSIPSSPSGFKLLQAYVVDPQGAGSFTLRFDGLTDAETIGVFKVVNGAWSQLPRAVLANGTAVEVTLPAQDPVLALARTSSGLGGIVKTLQDFAGGMDVLTLAIIGSAAFLLLVVVVALIVARRRRGGEYYY